MLNVILSMDLSFKYRKAISNIFKQWLVDCFSQNWHNVIETSPKAFHYRYFKTLFLMLNVILSMDLSFKYRKAISNFRCSSHNLMIENGRHVGIDRNLKYDGRSLFIATWGVKLQYILFNSKL